MSDIISAYISNLPETPYKAMGFNYTYGIDTKRDNIKKIFSLNDELFKKVFNNDYGIGGEVYYGIDKFSISLKISPDRSDGINAHYNYHLDCGVEKLSKAITRYLEMNELSIKTIGSLFNE